jgi:hypothetical protein
LFLFSIFGKRGYSMKLVSSVVVFIKSIFIINGIILKLY